MAATLDSFWSLLYFGPSFFCSGEGFQGVELQPEALCAPFCSVGVKASVLMSCLRRRAQERLVGVCRRCFPDDGTCSSSDRSWCLSRLWLDPILKIDSSSLVSLGHGVFPSLLAVKPRVGKPAGESSLFPGVFKLIIT